MSEKTFTHKYVGGGAFYPGLPMQDVSAEDLTDEQLAMLAEGVQCGMYETIAPPKKSKATAPEILSEDSTIG